MINDLQVYLFLLIIATVLLCLAVIAMFIFKRYKDKIKKKLIDLKKKTLYNGVIRSVYISYLEICLTTAIQFKLIIKGSKYLNPTSALVAIGSAVYLYGVIIVMVVMIFKFKRNFHKKEFKAKYENMYLGVKYWRNDYSIYYWPLFLFRRI